MNIPLPMNIHVPEVVARQLPRVVGPLGLGGIEPIRRVLSRAVINRFGYSTTLRPRALSLASDYTSWLSLTDRTYSGRHLPPSTPEEQAVLPPEADVVALYRREQLIPVDGHERDVHVLRPMVHRQLPADQP